MDIFTHALLGAAIAPTPELTIPMAISSTLPDLWTVPPLTEYMFKHGGRYRNQEFWKWIPPRYLELTRWSHSVFPLAVAFAIGSGVFRISPWVFLPWLLHLIIDIPTHARSRTGYVLYPLSYWQPIGMVNWYDKWWISIITIVLLAAIVFIRFGHG